MSHSKIRLNQNGGEAFLATYYGLRWFFPRFLLKLYRVCLGLDVTRGVRSEGWNETRPPLGPRMAPPGSIEWKVSPPVISYSLEFFNRSTLATGLVSQIDLQTFLSISTDKFIFKVIMDWIRLVLQFDILDVYRGITGSCQLRRRDNWALCMYPSRVNKCIKGVLNLIFYQIKGGKVFRHFRKSSRFTFKCSQARVDKNHVEFWVERLIFYS